MLVWILNAGKLALLALVCVAAMIGPASADRTDLPDYVISAYGHPPNVPSGPISKELQADFLTVFVDSLESSRWGAPEMAALDRIALSRDPRIAWLITDMLRFTWRPGFHNAQVWAAETLLGIQTKTHQPRHELTDHLIAWDIPDFPGYLDLKRKIFTNFVPGWEEIFVDGDIDWRLVGWGGVPIDARAYDQTETACTCIPAADNPSVSAADEAIWLNDEDIVFGVVINGVARAYPRQIMEVREMVNDTLGGRDIGIPYCTLCAAAQAFYTDNLPDGIERPILRTTGLLLRSNKVMYDLKTNSLFDTFLGRAVTGPLAEKGLVLKQAPVITTDWATWKAWHPETTVLVEELALGRNFNLRNTRDANGPIFPVGDVDPRLPVHEDIIGVVTASGQPVAFPRNLAYAALQSGAEIVVEDIRLQIAAGGIKATNADGQDIGSHQAFWFAWSQFHPETLLWQG